MKHIILPCPFCGSHTAPQLFPAVELNGNDDDDSCAVCCDCNEGGCGASGCYRQEAAAAVQAWNRRP